MTYEIALIIGFVLVLVLIVMIMYIYEERNRCKHIWEETNRSNWSRKWGNIDREFIKVELKCRRCGEVESREI